MTTAEYQRQASLPLWWGWVLVNIVKDLMCHGPKAFSKSVCLLLCLPFTHIHNSDFISAVSDGIYLGFIQWCTTAYTTFLCSFFYHCNDAKFRKKKQIMKHLLHENENWLTQNMCYWLVICLQKPQIFSWASLLITPSPSLSPPDHLHPSSSSSSLLLCLYIISPSLLLLQTLSPYLPACAGTAPSLCLCQCILPL